MLQSLEKFQSPNPINSICELEVYCREEGMDALYIRRTMKKERNLLKDKKTMSILHGLFSKLKRRTEMPGLSDSGY